MVESSNPAADVAALAIALALVVVPSSINFRASRSRPMSRCSSSGVLPVHRRRGRAPIRPPYRIRQPRIRSPRSPSGGDVRKGTSETEVAVSKYGCKWPALAALTRPVLVSMQATTTVANALGKSEMVKALSFDSASLGESAYNRYARRAFLSWAMVPAAATPCPATSPKMTATVLSPNSIRHTSHLQLDLPQPSRSAPR